MRRAPGFSLVELLAVIAIGAVLLAVGMPMYAQWIERSRAEAESTAFQLALAQARSESLGRGLRVVVAPLAADWSGGWRVFVDGNRDGSFDADAHPDDGLGSGDRELGVHQVADAVPVAADFSAGWADRIVFLPGAYVRGGSGGEIAGRMSFGRAPEIRSVCLSAMGRTQKIKGESCPG